MTKGDNDHDVRAGDLLRRGTQLLQRNRPEKAAELLERARSLGLESVDLLLNLSGAYILTKRFAAAAAVLETARNLDPQNAMIWTNLGAAYLGNPILATPDQQVRAIAAFQEALALNPAAPHVAYNIGLIYRDRRAHAIAAEWFRRALETDPDDRDAQRLLARMVAAAREEE